MTITFHRPSWVFIDTGGYFALASSRDENHAASVAIMEALRTERYRFYTSNFILAELHALLLTRINRRVALETLTALDHSATTVVRVTPADEIRAREIIVQYDDKNFSLTDATSFSIMDRLGIYQVLTFDGNFEQYGKTVLSPR
jgi:uncharacterized protein